MNITFIGLGIMGSRMAKHLLRLGHTLTVWNRTRNKAGDLVKAGAREAATLEEAVKEAEVIFTMLSTPDAVLQVADGAEGFLNKAKKNVLWINTSTINPSFARAMDCKAKEAGLRYLDAPVSGSLVPAEKAELIFLTGGEAADYEQAKPLLSLMGKNVHHLGKAGSGSSMKMVMNLMLAQSMLAFSETIALGLASGLSREVLFNVLLSSPLTPAYLQTKRAKLETGSFDTEFPLKWAHKDLHLVLQTAFEQEIALPLAGLAKELYGMAKEKGMGDKDISAIYSFVAEKEKK